MGGAMDNKGEPMGGAMDNKGAQRSGQGCCANASWWPRELRSAERAIVPNCAIGPVVGESERVRVRSSCTSKYRKPFDSAQARPSCSVTTLLPRSVLFAATTTMQFFAPYLHLGMHRVQQSVGPASAWE
eukprot:1183116-Prorocentrum_minimum.AAC.1